MEDNNKLGLNNKKAIELGQEYGQTSKSLSLSESFIDENNEVGEPRWESFNRSPMNLVLESLQNPPSFN